MEDTIFDELTEQQLRDVRRATSIVNALHFEATRIAQRRVGPIDASEVGSIVVALATIFAASPKSSSIEPVRNRADLDLSGFLTE